jgi:hypothetical protein
LADRHPCYSCYTCYSCSAAIERPAAPATLGAEMMKPYAGEIEAWEVGAEVGNVKNNRPELIERVGLV